MSHLTEAFVGVCYLIVGIYVSRRLLAHYAHVAAIRNQGCLPPRKYPHKDRVLGVDLLFNINRSLRASKFLSESQHRFLDLGRTNQTTSFGTATINTIEPKNLQMVYSLAFDNFGMEPLRRNMVKQLWGRGILSTDGAFWQHSRALIRPTFNRHQIANFDLMRVHVDRLLERIPQDGSLVDLAPLLKHYALDTSTEFLFGESVMSQLDNRPDEVEQFLKAFEYVSANIGRHRHMGFFTFLSRDKEWIEASKTIQSYIDRHVEKAMGLRNLRDKMKHEQTQPQRYVLLDEMAKLTDDKLDLRHQILHVFLPGHESTGVLLSAVFFVLAREPDVWKQLRHEVMSTALRLYPLFATKTRICLDDTILPLSGGPNGQSPIYISRDTVIASNLWAMHRDRELWGEDAENFKPERWSDAKLTWKYLPFSGGPRICIAQQLALSEAGYVIARFMQKFSIMEDRDGEPWQDCMSLSVRSKNGVKVGLIAA